MKVVFLEEKKNRLMFRIEGETHTLANALRDALNEDEHVKIAGYHVDHPLLGKPEFVIETDGADPKKVVLAAVKRLDKAFEKLSEEIGKALK